MTGKKHSTSHSRDQHAKIKMVDAVQAVQEREMPFRNGLNIIS